MSEAETSKTIKTRTKPEVIAKKSKKKLATKREARKKKQKSE